MILGVIGQPLLEAAAQTFIGAMASYTFDKIKMEYIKIIHLMERLTYGSGEFTVKILHMEIR